MRLTYKSQFVFPYASNKQLESEIENTMPFLLAPKKNVKSLGRNLKKHVQDVYEENHKTPRKKSNISKQVEMHSIFMDRKI